MPRQPITEVLIIGPDHNRAFKEDIIAENKAFYLQNGCLLIGNGVDKISREEIIAKLAGRVDGNTRFYVLGHGTAKSGAHNIVLLDDTNSTADVLRLLNGLTTDPVNIYLGSCFGGAAHNDLQSLKKGSTLITETEADDYAYGSSLIWFFQEKQEAYRSGRTLNPAQLFVTAMYRCSSTRTISIIVDDTEAQKYTFRPFLNRPIKHIETINAFLKMKVDEFITFYREHVDVSTELSTIGEITEQEAEALLNTHYENLIASASANEGKIKKHLIDFLQDPANADFLRSKYRDPLKLEKIHGLDADIKDAIHKLFEGYEILRHDNEFMSSSSQLEEIYRLLGRRLGAADKTELNKKILKDVAKYICKEDEVAYIDSLSGGIVNLLTSYGCIEAYRSKKIKVKDLAKSDIFSIRLLISEAALTLYKLTDTDFASLSSGEYKQTQIMLLNGLNKLFFKRELHPHLVENSIPEDKFHNLISAGALDAYKEGYFSIEELSRKNGKEISILTSETALKLYEHRMVIPSDFLKYPLEKLRALISEETLNIYDLGIKVDQIACYEIEKIKALSSDNACSIYKAGHTTLEALGHLDVESIKKLTSDNALRAYNLDVTFEELATKLGELEFLLSDEALNVYEITQMPIEELALQDESTFFESALKKLCEHYGMNVPSNITGNIPKAKKLFSEKAISIYELDGFANPAQLFTLSEDKLDEIMSIIMLNRSNFLKAHEFLKFEDLASMLQGEKFTDSQLKALSVNIKLLTDERVMRLHREAPEKAAELIKFATDHPLDTAKIIGKIQLLDSVRSQQGEGFVARIIESRTPKEPLRPPQPPYSSSGFEF